jgi:energy-coupling factor transporter ATP-binding protein EcfA2
MVGVTGPPGGGKTTLTLLMERRINERASEYGLDGPASVVPMDGEHSPGAGKPLARNAFIVM